ncbi:MAG: RDD family protein [Pyrinomonadaceae bacterium]
MAPTAQTMTTSSTVPKTEKAVNFSPALLKAPFFLRCAALFVDYIVLLVVPIGWLMWESTFGDPGANIKLGTSVWTLGIIFWLLNFLALPLFRGQTIGKMLAGLTILNIDGTYVGIVGIVRRNIVGYLLTCLTLGLGFLISAVNSSGRSLHDFVAGTIVVRGRRKQS